MKSRFGSASIRIHLARGALAAMFAVCGVLSLATKSVFGAAFALVAAGGALVLLRGCPMCWTIGLIETIAKSDWGARAELNRQPRP
jgi:hypothetical protein